jgi:ABC-type glycerol-3-phosphate transport system substrate-binding protein
MVKRNFIKMALAACLSLILVLTGCSSEETPGANQSPEPGTASDKPVETDKAQQKITLTIPYPKPDKEAERKAADDKMKRFKEKYPNVEFKTSDWLYSEGGAATLAVKMAANEAPSYYNTYATEAKVLTEKGYAADITEFMNKYEYADQFNRSLFDIFKIDDKVYAVPTDGYVMSIGVNAKLFKEKNVPLPPLDWTWNELLEAAKQVNDPAKGIAGFAVAAKTNAAGWNFTNFLYQSGEFVEAVQDGKATATFNSEAAATAMEFYRNLRWDANVLPGDWNLANPDLSALYKQGRLGIILHAGSLNTAINDGGMSPDDVRIYPLPSIEKGKPNYAITGGNYFVINPKISKEEQEMAFNYIVFDFFQDSGIAAEEKTVQERQANNQMHIPSSIMYYEQNSEYGQKVQAMYDKYPGVVYKYDPAFLSSFSTNAMPEPPFYAQDFYAEMTNIIQEVFTDKNADYRKLLADAQQKFQVDFLDKIE